MSFKMKLGEEYIWKCSSSVSSKANIPSTFQNINVKILTVCETV